MEQVDLFHNVVMTEEINQQQGYEEGRESGRHQGFQLGYKLGWEKGAAVGSEVGFYAGFAKSLLEEMTEDTEIKSRLIKTLEKIVVIAETFPLSDPHTVDLHTKLDQLQTKYKQVCSLLGMTPVITSFQRSKLVSF